MKHCFGYTRVSTKKQGEGASLETQETAIKEYAAKNGIKITTWFVEQQSAAKSGRPEFNRMLRELKRGKAEGVVIYKIDRSARNFADWAKVGELADAGIEVCFASESLDFDSRGGRLSADIQAVIAADFIRNHRNNVREGQQTRLKNGHYPFKAPLGYLDQGRGKLKVLDPTRSALVRQMFELYASGNYPFWALADEMAARGLRNHFGKPVTKTNIEKILKNPFYMGVIKIARTGMTYQGAHEPLVSVSLFEAVQKMRADRDNKKETRHRLFYRGGLFRCGLCNTAMIGERQKGHVYYRCHTRECPTKGVREEQLHDPMLEKLKTAVLSDEDHARLVAMFGKIERDLKRDPMKEQAPLELARINDRKDRLTDKLIDGVIGDDVFTAKKEALEIEERKWHAVAAKTQKSDNLVAKLSDFLEHAKSLYLSYQSANPDQKREIVRIATSNRTVTEKKVGIDPDNWLRTIGKLAELALCEEHGASSRTVSKVTIEKLTAQMAEQATNQPHPSVSLRNPSIKSAQSCISLTR